MRIGVIGAGGVGGYFGGRLAQAGLDVVFLARGDHLAAMRKDGLRIESPLGDAHVERVQATDDPAEAGKVDFALIGVKAWQVPEVAGAIGPMVSGSTTLLPLQNGVEAAGQLSATYGSARVLGGLCKIISMVAGPGRIRHVGVEPAVTAGEMDRSRSRRLEELAAIFDEAGIRFEASPDIEVDLWTKFLFITSVSGVGAVSGLSLGEMRSDPESRKMLTGCMEEIMGLARARGIAMDPETVDKALAFIETLPAEGKPSMQRDIEEGRPSELEYQTGAVVRLGRESGFGTPVNEAILGRLAPREAAARRAGP